MDTKPEIRARDMTPERLREYSRDHLCHELHMFYWLAGIIDYMDPGALHNALLESFVVHLRNLIDFFFRPPSAHATDVSAENFFGDPKQWQENLPAILDEARERANKELSHLTTGRKNLDDPERTWDVDALFAEIEQLTKTFLQRVLSSGMVDDKLRAFLKKVPAEQGWTVIMQFGGHSTVTPERFTISNNATRNMGLFYPRPKK